MQLANCWLTAEVWPDEAVSEMRRQVHGVVPVADNVHTDVSEVVILMATSRLGDDFEGVSESERSRAGEQWFAAEDDVGALDETVDMAQGGGKAELEERMASCSLCCDCSCVGKRLCLVGLTGGPCSPHPMTWVSCERAIGSVDTVATLGSVCRSTHLLRIH